MSIRGREEKKKDVHDTLLGDESQRVAVMHEVCVSVPGFVFALLGFAPTISTFHHPNPNPS